MIRRTAMLLAIVFGAAVVLVVVLGAIGWLHSYRVPASSMEPTLHCGRPQSLCEGKQDDRFVALGYHFFAPARGDIVAFRTPPAAEAACGIGGTFVKRIVGLPGDAVAEKAGILVVDGKRLPEPYVAAGNRDRRDFGPVRVPRGHYFLLGDNRSASCDSREWGSVPRADLIGKLVLRYWPPARIHLG